MTKKISIKTRFGSILVYENKGKIFKIEFGKLKKQKKQMGVDLRELSDKYSEHKKIDSNMYM